MALITCSFFSESLMMHTAITVVLPSKTIIDVMTNNDEFYQSEKKFKTMFLLHGASDDHTMWIRKTNVERYAEEKKLAVVMPAVGLSFYTDMVYGQKYWTYVSEELPRFVRRVFPLSEEREDNFVAGLSMGGYGALKLALRKPENFVAAASLSGAIDIVEVIKPDMINFEGIFGDVSKVKDSENDLFYLLRKLKEDNKDIPRLFVACGTNDFLYSINVKFRDYVR